MLKVSRTLLMLLAALGMSSVVAQTGPAVGGYSTTVNGNTTSHTYNSNASSDFARLTRGGYDPATNQSGFQALLQKKGFTPKGSEYDYRVTKPVPKPALAKAIAKTLPVVGNLILMKELLDELFPNKNARWDSQQSRWEYDETTQNACWDLTDRGFGCVPDPTSYCNAVHPSASWYGPDPGNVNSGRCLNAPGGVQYGFPFSRIVQSQTTEEVAVTEPLLESKLDSLPTIPPEADPLIQYIPSAALDDLADDIAADTSNKPTAVPTSPSGSPFEQGVHVPESITESQINQGTQTPQTVITTIETFVRPLPSGQLQHDEKTTTTTTTQIGTNPDGSPITESTTTTATTTTTPAPPGSTDSSQSPPTQEIITCGLPNTPPCKIDESGTPPPGDVNFDAANEEIEVFKTGLYEALQSKLDEIVHEWTWTFELPTGCSALQFDTRVGPVVQIDMCEFQPMIHDIMSMLWAAAGVFGALMIFLRANG